jgi:hypothetical protein
MFSGCKLSFSLCIYSYVEKATLFFPIISTQRKSDSSCRALGNIFMDTVMVRSTIQSSNTSPVNKQDLAEERRKI